MSRELEIRKRLEALITVEEISFEDFSDQHSGHYSPVQPEHGASHVHLKVVSPNFSPLNRIQRSRLVYSALEDLFEKKGLHSLTLKLLGPEEK